MHQHFQQYVTKCDKAHMMHAMMMQPKDLFMCENFGQSVDLVFHFWLYNHMCMDAYIYTYILEAIK